MVNQSYLATCKALHMVNWSYPATRKALHIVNWSYPATCNVMLLDEAEENKY